MSDMLADAAAWLSDIRRTHVSQAVTYVRGDLTVEVQATVGSTKFPLNTDDGGTIEYVARDYIIAVEDLVFGSGDPVEPQRGDKIIEGDRTYECMGPGGGEQDWRYSDPHHLAYRIHTKQVS